jgi:ATP-dependent DNA helicase RecG
MDKEQLINIIKNGSEAEGLEFKTASHDFSILGGSVQNKKCLYGYCVAIGNSGGGKVIFGVDDKVKIVGTSAFSNFVEIRSQVYNKLNTKIEIEEFILENKRIVVVTIPGRQKGQLFDFYGKYLTRVGQELVEMKQSEIKNILNETSNDHSAEVLNLDMGALDVKAIKKIRLMYEQKNKENIIIRELSDEQFLTDLALLKNGKINNSTLLLLGKESFIQEHIPNAEIIFEYRNNPGDIKYVDRVNLRSALVMSLDELWMKINSRNYTIQLSEGLTRRNISAFNEDVMREAILNAVVHRNYLLPTSVFILQDQSQITFKNPGGFLSGITPENIYKKSAWRNRRLAETFEKIGLAERSGQGADLIFENTIKEGKGVPNYSDSSDSEVILQLSAVVQDMEFVTYLEDVIAQKKIRLSIDDLILLEKIKDQNAEKITKDQVKKFLDIGIVSFVGFGRGTRYLLAKQYYKDHGLLGKYTKIVGLGRDKIKEMILKHIKDNGKGSGKEFAQAFPELSPKDIDNIVQELRRNEKIKFVGTNTRTGHWVSLGDN